MRMKNRRSSLLLIAVLALLAGISFYLATNKDKTSTVDKESRDFKVEDTAAVTKIFLANKNGDQSTVEKTEKGWVVNNKYVCRPEAIKNLLYTMKVMEVKSPVAKAAKPNILKAMSAQSIKVEVYRGNELIKQYYIGSENQYNDGTYMLLTDIETGRNYEEPYLLHIPGFNGFLSTRFIVKENEWRDRTVAAFTPPQLREIKVENGEYPDSSFTIQLKSTNDFVLTGRNVVALPFDELKMKQYIAYFQNLQYEGLLESDNKRLTDSLKNVIAYYTISITDKNDKKTVMDFLRKKSTPELNQKYDFDYVYDPDRLYLRFNNDQEYAVIQYFVFGKVLQTYKYFQPQSSVKK